jgi:hypothetical protein
MYVRATVQCHKCDKLRAVYCKQPPRKLEKLHAGRMMLAPTATAMRATTQTLLTTMAVTAWGAALQSRKKISRREVQWLTATLMAPQQLVLLAMQQNLRSRKHKALARTARTQHGDVRSVQQPRQVPLVWCRTQQTLTRHSQHRSLMSCRLGCTCRIWLGCNC